MPEDFFFQESSKTWEGDSCSLSDMEHLSNTQLYGHSPLAYAELTDCGAECKELFYPFPCTKYFRNQIPSRYNPQSLQPITG